MSLNLIIFFLFVLVSSIFAWFVTLFTYIPNLFSNGKFRHHLPLICGLVIVAFFLLINPQQEPGSLYWGEGWFQYLLLPLFLFAPLPYFKKWKNIVFSKVDIFLGAMLSADYYFAFLLSGRQNFEELWLIDPLLWVAGTFIVAFLIYWGIALCEEYFPDFPQEPANSQDRKNPQFSAMGMKKVAVIVVFIFLLWLPFGIFGEPEGDMCGGTIPVYSIGSSADVSAITNATIIHLTQEDFGAYLELGSYLKKHHVVSSRYQRTIGGKNFTVESLPGIHFRCGSESRMYDYGAFENWDGEPTKFVEYDGKFYYLGTGYIA